ncbi:MAG: bifunctional N-acetylglucosamine-1-phosphate uridyltransferase/glucosamine-1-phosphate acetyltransferase [Planctomycetales bacterium]
MSPPVAVVLAAGKSTRMKSALPKVLHEVCGRPMIDYVLDAARASGIGRLVVIVGHEAQQVQRALARSPGVEFALQSEQKGTGHAVMMCRDNLRDHDGAVLILTGDAPLMRGESFTALLDDFHKERAACVIGTAETANNFGLGRIVRDAQGEFVKIVEQKDASPEEAAIREINVGCYVFDGRRLFEALDQLQPNNKQKEFYLTDCCGILRSAGHRVVASQKLNVVEALGVNTRAQLVEVQRALQQRFYDQLMSNGVTIVDPAQSSVDLRAQIGADTIIEPFTSIVGPARIGSNCRIGPHAYIGPNAVIPDGARVGPFQQLG